MRRVPGVIVLVTGVRAVVGMPRVTAVLPMNGTEFRIGVRGWDALALGMTMTSVPVTYL